MTNATGRTFDRGPSPVNRSRPRRASSMKVLRVRRWSAALAALVTTSALAVALGSSPAAAAGGTGTGYLHTSGNKIVDSTGATVRLTGINWFGMETDNKTFHGLWASNPWQRPARPDGPARLQHAPPAVLQRALKPGATATGINDYINPDLVGLIAAADPGQGRRLRRAARACGSSSTGTARPPPGRPPLWYTAAASGEHLDQRLEDARPALRGQHHRHRRRPAQRAARRGHQPGRHRRLLGLRRHRPATGGWPPSGPATRSSRSTRTG